MGPRFRVSSERLEKPGIEPRTPGLEGEQLNHYATEASILQDDLNSLAQWKTNGQMEFNFAKFHSVRVNWHPPQTSKYYLTTHCNNKDSNRFSPPNTLE